MVPALLQEIFKESMPGLNGIISLISQVTSAIISMGLITVSLRFCDGDKGEFSDLFSCVPLLINYLVGSILYVLIMAGGTLLLVVPGIIWMIKFQFFTYLIVDRKLGPVKALKKLSRHD